MGFSFPRPSASERAPKPATTKTAKQVHRCAALTTTRSFEVGEASSKRLVMSMHTCMSCAQVESGVVGAREGLQGRAGPDVVSEQQHMLRPRRGR